MIVEPFYIVWICFPTRITQPALGAQRHNISACRQSRYAAVVSGDEEDNVGILEMGRVAVPDPQKAVHCGFKTPYI